MNGYLYKTMKILSVREETPIDRTYTLAYEGPLVGGQFFQVSLPGVGEAPISISDFDGKTVDMTVRNVGRLTSKIFDLKEGDSLFYRGPYGNGFTTEPYKGKRLLLIAGGTGLAPVKSVLRYAVENADELEAFQAIVGFKSPEDILFTEDLKAWQDQVDLRITVDREAPGWRGKVGMVTEHMDDLDLSDPEHLQAVVVGPPMMMKFTVMALQKRGLKDENIWVSYERNMSCGVGKCGHCKIDDTYVCVDGPVFTFDQAKHLLD